MNNINFKNDLDIYNEDWIYLYSQGIERFIKQVFIYSMEPDNRIAGGVISGWNLQAVGSQIQVNTPGTTGVAFTKYGDPVISSNSFLVDLIDISIGHINYIVLEYLTSTGNYSDESSGRTDPVTNIKYFTQLNDSFAIRVFTSSQWVNKTSAQQNEYIMLGQVVAGSMDITSTGKFYISSLIQPKKLDKTKFINNLNLAQTQVANSFLYDDSFSGSKITLQNDLNEIRTLIKAITGEAVYNNSPDGSLSNFDIELNYLHGEGVFQGYLDELVTSSGYVMPGKAIVNQNVITLLTSTALTFTGTGYDTIQLSENGIISIKNNISSPPLPDYHNIVLSQSANTGAIIKDARTFLKRISQQQIVYQFSSSPYPVNRIGLHTPVGYIDTSTGVYWHSLTGTSYLNNELYYTSTGGSFATTTIFAQTGDDLYLIVLDKWIDSDILVDIDGSITSYTIDTSDDVYQKYQRNFKIGTNLTQGYHKVEVTLVTGTLYLNGLIYGNPDIIDIFNAQVTVDKIRNYVTTDKIAQRAVTMDKMNPKILLALGAAMRGVSFNE